MPIPWMTVLKSVPWIDVIRNAPQVVDAARRLWQSTRSDERARAAAPRAAVGPPTAAGGEHAVLRARVDALEGELRTLHEQVLASSELIRQLAEQQAGLVARVELNRRRTIRLAIAVAVSAAIAIAALVFAASR